ncbi:MAG: ABC transporter ATP-binding protein [Bacillota bacterium]|nr:ABC transporter ATP-binding protein [Bacillota bacterium]
MTQSKLEARSLSFAWGEQKILNDISLNAQEGAFIGIIGPNGSGKSTFLKCVYRVLRQREGCVYLDGRDVRKMSYKETARMVGVVAQHNSYDFDFLVSDIVLMGRSPHKSVMARDNAEDYVMMRNALFEVGLEGFESRPFASLSGGEQQRVILARALAQQTPVLVLDEPTNHLDIKFQLQLLETVKKQNKTVLAAFHDLNIAAMYSDRIYVMHQGKIRCQGKPSEVLTGELIREVYGVNAKVTVGEEGYPYIQFLR